MKTINYFSKFTLTSIFILGLFHLLNLPVLANQKIRIESIVLSGNQSFNNNQILKLMDVKVGEIYDKELIRNDADRITKFYKNKGFIYARVIESPNIINDEVFIRLIIDEGRIRSFTLTGNTKTKENVILRELLFTKNDVYIEADRKESERILRQKPYIGAAKIESQWNENLQGVDIHVTVTEYFSLTGALDPGINNQTGYFLLQMKDTNLFGSGQGSQIRYERISEVGEKTRGFVTMKYRIPRLFDSHLNFDGQYIQDREGDSWSVFLERPQYSLKSRWSGRLGISELINQVRWYEHGIRTDTFEQTNYRAFGNVVRYFGDRHHQNYIGMWFNSTRINYYSLESVAQSIASPMNQDIKRVGVLLGRRNIGFHKTRFLTGMGGEEDFVTGSIYNLLVGYSSPIYGSDRTQTYTSLSFNSGWESKNRLFGTALIDFSTGFTDQIEHSVIQSQCAFYIKDVFNSGDIYRVDKGFRKNGLIDFHQTIVAQFKSLMQYGWRGESQVLLGADNGLRGYAFREFSGEKMMLLSIESRTLCGGSIFNSINNGLTKIVTFIAKPFVKNRTIDLGLIMSFTSFIDFGYIWDSENPFNEQDVKRGVGLGLRGSFAKVSDAGIFRFEVAFPLDPTPPDTIKPHFFYGIERVF